VVAYNDLTNIKFGKLTVKYKVIKKSGKGQRIYWYCECDCGGNTVVRSDNLTGGDTKSCGCINANAYHHRRGHRLYGIWSGIKHRCSNPNNQSYFKYGGRGIIICEEWQNDFMNFYNWAMGNGYSDDLSIDRIDVNGNYEPSNCRWATAKVQANNRTNTRYIEIGNEIKPISEWSEISRVDTDTILIRYEKGIRGKDLLNPPLVAEYKSGVKYITWNKVNKGWIVKYKYKNEIHHIGCFKDLDEAIIKQEEFKSTITNK
jgi:hypothetical protein